MACDARVHHILGLASTLLQCSASLLPALLQGDAAAQRCMGSFLDGTGVVWACVHAVELVPHISHHFGERQLTQHEDRAPRHQSNNRLVSVAGVLRAPAAARGCARQQGGALQVSMCCESAPTQGVRAADNAAKLSWHTHMQWRGCSCSAGWRLSCWQGRACAGHSRQAGRQPSRCVCAGHARHASGSAVQGGGRQQRCLQGTETQFVAPTLPHRAG
jgi:hypothetical protein